MDEADELLDGLDSAQRRAVTTTAHPLAIIAPAGSGKTTVLTRRIAHRVATGTADADHVVALTFTRQAATELRNRLWRLDVRGTGLRVGTFHAVAHGLLRQRWADQSRRAPTLLAANRRLIAEVLGARTSPDEIGAIATELEWSRATLVAPERYAEMARRTGRKPSVAPDRVAACLVDYAALKRRKGVVDFDDLLADCAAELRRDPAYAAGVRWRFRHLFVDEFQDLNPLQHALLEAWRGDRPDICVVGDPRQAIYGWNGSNPALLERVEETLPGVTIVRLRNNYRCSPQVVAAAASVLTRAGTDDDTISTRTDGPVVEFAGARDEGAEAELIARRVRGMRPAGGRWASIGVLARTNAQLPTIAQALERVGIPTSIIGAAGRTYIDPSAAGLLDDARQIRRTAALLAWATDLAEGIDEAPPRPIEASMSAAVRRFVGEIPDGDGVAFADWYLLGAGESDSTDAVELLTFHAAKGREWRAVVVTGVERDLVPHYSARSAEARAEEARLAHVAFSRAGHELVVTWARERNGRTTGPSPLIDDSAQPSDLTTVFIAPPVRPIVADPAASARRMMLESLRSWRLRAARAANLPATGICSDAALVTLATERPSTLDEVIMLAGLGPSMARHLGPRMLAAIDAARAEAGVTPA